MVEDLTPVQDPKSRRWFIMHAETNQVFRYAYTLQMSAQLVIEGWIPIEKDLQINFIPLRYALVTDTLGPYNAAFHVVNNTYPINVPPPV